MLDAGRSHGSDVTHAISTAARPGGRVIRDAVETVLAQPLAAASAVRWDGVFLMLRGAKVTEDIWIHRYDALNTYLSAGGPPKWRAHGAPAAVLWPLPTTPIAGRIIVCDTGALSTMQYDWLPYITVPRPIFPLDR